MAVGRRWQLGRLDAGINVATKGNVDLRVGRREQDDDKFLAKCRDALESSGRRSQAASCVVRVRSRD